MVISSSVPVMVYRTVSSMVMFAAGCGRIGFDWRSDAPDGTGNADGGSLMNRAFVTQDMFPANLGGLAGADAKCAAAAVAAGLDGTFIAVLSTTTTNAIDRISGSRGWVRVDGAPFVDTADAIFDTMPQSATGELNPLAVDEHGNAISSPVSVWTGTTSDGKYDVTRGACGDWTTTASQSVEVGDPARAFQTLSFSADNCSSSARLACFEVGKSVSVSPVAIDGRIAFQSTQTGLGGGLAALDAQCMSDAMAAGLPGTYLAAAATSTSTISSRFTIDTRPWRRIDGTFVADGATLFTSGPVSFVHESADGSYLFFADFWWGADTAQSLGNLTTTCIDWTSTSAIDAGRVGIGGSIGVYFWNPGGATSCNQLHSTLCLQE
jgi:hypothetical protein